MAGHAQLKFVMTECSKTQIRLTGLNWFTGKKLKQLKQQLEQQTMEFIRAYDE